MMKVVYITDARGVKITYSCSKCGLIFNQRFIPNGVFEEDPDISMLVPVKCPCGERQLMSMEGECNLTLHPDDEGIGPQKVSFVRYLPTSVEVSFVDVPTAQGDDPDAKI
jgi:DNA-directed RNA polymerase subunit RPC12/RpoP